jgi:hypothetical protein
MANFHQYNFMYKVKLQLSQQENNLEIEQHQTLNIVNVWDY